MEFSSLWSSVWQHNLQKYKCYLFHEDWFKLLNMEVKVTNRGCAEGSTKHKDFLP